MRRFLKRVNRGGVCMDFTLAVISGALDVKGQSTFSYQTVWLANP
jgi:uncharacterized protein with von Willebrand factor type A (vWA) domain